MESFSFTRIPTTPNFYSDPRIPLAQKKADSSRVPSQTDSINSQISLIKEQAVFESNMVALKTADQMTGTLLDTFA